MSFYNNYILPNLTDFVCRLALVNRQRQKIVPLAFGKVLEVGLGSGLNLPFYDHTKVEKLWGLEPSPRSMQKAKKRSATVKFKIDFLESSVMQIPLESCSANCILTTYTLCTIPDIKGALQEIARVLKPQGQLIFCEHGKAPDPEVSCWQDRLNPFWKTFSGGCNLNRDIPHLITRNGFSIKQMQSGYISKPRTLSYHYWGIATHC
ncbi:MAG: class I SAM-dependent methyltransferase [Deltaproteobacteria bacterium]|jgi:ubiquinone/menaquinone biosynthesis C-methylase UbiE|nr:class I SAM-dependent methyltransferase [Deltaproteobacteria bacterium]